MNLSFTPEAWDDYQHWLATDRATLKRLNRRLSETLRTPFEVTGKPEALRYELSGAWSRRIDQEHRLVYVVEQTTVIVVRCRAHYHP